MVDRYGTSASFNTTKIDHSRPEQNMSGIPRNPGRPSGASDAMPRNRQSSPTNKQTMPGWSMGMLKSNVPDWAATQLRNRVETPKPATPSPAQMRPQGNQLPEWAGQPMRAAAEARPALQAQRAHATQAQQEPQRRDFVNRVPTPDPQPRHDIGRMDFVTPPMTSFSEGIQSQVSPYRVNDQAQAWLPMQMDRHHYNMQSHQQQMQDLQKRFAQLRMGLGGY